MVVGDEDQSIYKFRGADINNILDFENSFSDAEVIRLEENYRSTNSILKAANHVIKNNINRLGKNLFSTRAEGEKITLVESFNESDEVEKIVYIIHENNFEFNGTAILYRTNNQSRAFEQYFNKNKIPYVIFGSIRFFDREEIKDSVSILKWLVNPKDEVSFSRFINKPVRGIGEKTLTAFLNEAKNYSDIFNALENLDKIELGSRAKETFKNFFEIFKDKESIIKEISIDKIIMHYLEKLDLINYYKEHDKLENSEKIENIHELIKSVEGRGSDAEAINDFLEEVSLATQPDEIRNNSNRIKLMTVHNAKGLEFDNVFISGVEKDLFPHRNSYELEDIEEERRLFYVAITRAKNHLFITYSKKRNLFGKESSQMPSEFIEELPKELIEFKFKAENSGFSPAVDFAEGDVVKHKDYGKGRIILLKIMNGKHYAQIDFWDSNTKEFILEHTLNKLEKVFD